MTSRAAYANGMALTALLGACNGYPAQCATQCETIATSPDGPLGSGSWRDVRRLPNVKGSGTAADPYRGWDTQLTGSKVVYHFPAGTYDFDRIRVSGTGVRLVGDGPFATVLRARRTDGVSIDLTGELDALESMDVVGRGTPAPSLQHILVRTGNFPDGGSQFHLDHLRLDGAFGQGMVVTGDTQVNDVRLFATTAGGVGIHLLDAISVTLSNVVVLVSANVSVAIEVEGAGRTPDTIHFDDVAVGYQGGTAWTALAVMAHSEQSAPEWMKVVNSSFEAPADASRPNPFPAVLLSAGRSLYFSNTYILGGRDGVAIGEDGRFQGPADIKFDNCVFLRSLRNGIRHDATAPTSVTNATVSDNSQGADAQDAGIFLGARSRGFSMVGGLVGNGIVLGLRSGQAYGLETERGADDFAIAGVRYGRNRLANVRGGVCPALNANAELHPTCSLHHLVGSGAIHRIAAPPFEGPLTLIADGDILFLADGNVSSSLRLSKGAALMLTYDAASDRWFPYASY